MELLDLNYRLNMPDADIRHLLSSPLDLRRPNMELMLKFDQVSCSALASLVGAI